MSKLDKYDALIGQASRNLIPASRTLTPDTVAALPRVIEMLKQGDGESHGWGVFLETLYDGGKPWRIKTY